MLKLYLIVILIFCTNTSLIAKTLDTKAIPIALKPWVDWVLFDENERNCPFLYNANKQIQCSWPSLLELALNNSSGKFKQTWLIYKTAWVQLPGDIKTWPQNVTINDKIAVVTERNNKPYISLKPGHFTIKGDFLWQNIPENLNLASNTGIIKLKVKGQSIKLPKVQQNGQLWLRDQDIGQVKQANESDNLEIQVYRKITDEIPLRMTTQIDLNVSGSHREILLGKALLENFIPLELQSMLPARIEANGRLRIQIRPGNWTIKLTARYPGPLSKITLSQPAQPWPLSEIWSFESRHFIRVVEIKGAQSIDPRQTKLPSEWMLFPAYEMKPGTSMIFKTVRRGDPEPAPNSLILARHMWLDFHGTGYTIKDNISGRMTRGWRIETQAELKLGRVTIDGQAQFITQLPNSKNKGVEIRRANINLEADSRYTSSLSKIPVTGWEHDFLKVSSTLHLPPGWKVFSAFGVDNLPDTWLQRWTLLDLFLVLIISITIWRLWGVSWGIISILTLVMIWHQANAPQLIWITILAAVALIRVLPNGKIKNIISAFRYISLIFLLIISLPFLVSEIRSGLYPILEFPNQTISETQFTQDNTKVRNSPALVSPTSVKSYKPNKLRKRLSQAYSAEKQIAQYDPKSNIQTGPGLPEWNWRSINLRWNGPVKRDQQVFLLLLSPNLNMALQFLHVTFLSLLILLMLGFRYTKIKKFSFNISNISPIILVSIFYLSSPDVQAASYPSEKLLEQLKSRLLPVPECVPNCAQISRMKLKVTRNNINIRLEVHSLAHVSIPLPTHLRYWIPNKILIDGKQARGIERTKNELRITLSKGRHQILMSGAIGNVNLIQLPLPLKPKRIDVVSSGWTVNGILKNSVPDQQLQIIRNQPRATQLQLNSLDATALPSFVKITRTLHIGLDWRITTTVQRISSSENAVVFKLPLIKGESVTTDGIRVSNNHIQVSLATRKNFISWNSVLEKQVQIELIANDTIEWIENWRLDISPIWNVKFYGIPVVRHFNQHEEWRPEWRPWPGERLTVKFIKPLGFNGKTLTIDKSELFVKPGSRTEDVKLKLSIRSSQGGQHTIVIPNNSTLQSVRINDVQKAIRQETRNISIPVKPGKQIVDIEWTTTKALKSLLLSPKVDIGIDNVNHTSKIQLGYDRWVLFVGGPRLGPAVLFWGEIILLFFIALALGKIKAIPLTRTHWFLLGIGLSQIPIAMALIIVSWLFFLLIREKYINQLSPVLFNSTQILLVIFTLLSLGFIFFAIQHGLLGTPTMQITGNGSTGNFLKWYQDRANAVLPTSWLVSVPVIYYRLLMLAWALWIAFSLINWLRWAWMCFSKETLWKKIEKSTKTNPNPNPEKNKAITTDTNSIN